MATATTQREPPPRPIIIYEDDGLTGGWADWSWDAERDLHWTDPPNVIGRSAIQVSFTDAWGGLRLHYEKGIEPEGYYGISISIRAESPGQQLAVQLRGASWESPLVQLNRWYPADPSADHTPSTTDFTRYDIPFSSFGWGLRPITDLVIHNFSGAPSPAPFYVDEVQITRVLPSACQGVPQRPEIRGQNYVQNHQGRVSLPPLADPRLVWEQDYYPLINGDCTGTTEQILEWAARKWGFADQPSVLGGPPLYRPDLAKAMAVKESWWQQNHQGDPECKASRPNGIASSFGILQVKNRVCTGEQEVWSNSYPESLRNTALNADYAMSVVRAHYDGALWLKETKGDLKRAIGAWFCGCDGSAGEEYTREVLEAEARRPWVDPGVPEHLGFE